ncbi:MAG: sulfotransferase [Chromatiaceae bacterium]|nr:sulfotransferase [Chromatiaceae bacterium]
MTHPRTLIIGSPRSGTTWVGKLFDANPWVVYLHEPDSDAWTTAIPGTVNREDYDRHLQTAAEYLDRIFAVSTVKTNGGRVRFAKAYRSHLGELAFRSLFLGLRAMEQFAPLQRIARNTQIPQLIAADRLDKVYQVAKSVIAGGRAGLYARARPDMRFILILRHPAGVVGSEIRGKKIGKMIGEAPIKALATMPGAVERGLTQQFFEQADYLERMSWWWVLFNEKMMADTQDCENCLLVNYDEMCANPKQAVHSMYRHAGIELADEVVGFLDKSTTASTGDSEYFNLFRDPQEAANRWRHELSAEQIERIRAITQATAPGSMFRW